MDHTVANILEEIQELWDERDFGTGLTKIEELKQVFETAQEQGNS